MDAAAVRAGGFQRLELADEQLHQPRFHARGIEPQRWYAVRPPARLINVCPDSETETGEKGLRLPCLGFAILDRSGPAGDGKGHSGSQLKSRMNEAGRRAR